MLVTVIFLPWSNSPSGPRPPHWQGFMITRRHTTFHRTPLGEWSARRRDLYLTTRNIHKTDIYAPGGIRTHNPSKRAAAKPRLRPRGYWDRRLVWLLVIIMHGVYNDKYLFRYLYWQSRSTATYRHLRECIAFKIAKCCLYCVLKHKPEITSL